MLRKNIRSAPKSSCFWPILLIFLIALSLRVLNVLQFHTHDPMFDRSLPGLDMYHFERWILNILDTNWLDRENTPFWQEPLYPYTMALVMSIFGRDFLWPKLFQALLGSLSCMLIYFIGRRAFSRSVGIIASLLACFYGMFLLYEAILLRETMLTFLYLLSILTLLIAKEKGRLRWYLIAGVCLGLSINGRPNVIVFAPAALLWIWVYGFEDSPDPTTQSARKFWDGLSRSRFTVSILRREAPVDLGQSSGSRKAACIAVLLAGVVLTILPVTMKNYLVGGRFVLLGTSGGYNFYMGNCRDATGTLTVTDSMLKIAPDLYYAKDKDLAKINWFGLAMEQIAADPLRFVRLLLRKFYLYWGSYEIPNNANYYLDRQFSWVLRLPLIPFWVVLPLAATGIVLSLREWPRPALLLLFIFTYMCSILLVYVVDRYRVPMVPYLLIFAAYAIAWWFEKVTAKDFRGLAFSLIPLLLVGTFSLATRSEYVRTNDYYNLALAYQNLGRYDRAVEEYLSALDAEPYFNPARKNLITCYLTLRQPEKAQKLSEEGIRLEPDNAEAFFNLATVLLSKGEREAAAGNLEHAVALDPNYIAARKKLARIYSEQGKVSAALLQWGHVLEIDPTDKEAAERIASFGQVPD